MAIVINGQTGIDAGHLPISNAGNTEIEGTLTGADVTVASITANNVTTQGQNVSPFSGFKNYIINGNFDVWQYGTSQTSSGYGSDDRWINSNAGSTKTHSQVACTDTERALFNVVYFSRTVVSSVAGTGNYVAKYQKIEDVTRLAGKTVTISFWARADSSKKIWFEFSQNFGAGGTPSAALYGTNGKEILLTNTWTKYSYTTTIPSIVGKTLGTDGVHTSSTYLQFWFEGGSSFTTRVPGIIQQSGTFDIAQVQLEEGSVATPFENRPYGLELSLCQRYYETGNGYGLSYASSAAAYQRSIVMYSVSKRLPPATVVTKLGGVATNPSIGYTTNTMFMVAFSSARDSEELYYSYTASAEL